MNSKSVMGTSNKQGSELALQRCCTYTTTKTRLWQLAPSIRHGNWSERKTLKFSPPPSLPPPPNQKSAFNTFITFAFSSLKHSAESSKNDCVQACCQPVRVTARDCVHNCVTKTGDSCMWTHSVCSLVFGAELNLGLPFFPPPFFLYR